MIDRRNYPPMPREEFMRQELLSFARKFVILAFVSLVILAIVFPWGGQ